MSRDSDVNTKDAILEAACLLFAEYGYDGVRTRMVAEVAKVNIASIHYHFGSKESLYIAAFRVAFQSQSSLTVDDILAGRPDLLDTDEGKAEAVRSIISDFFDKRLNHCEEWKQRLILREICQNSSVHATLVEEVFIPGSQNFSNLCKRICPENDEIDSYILENIPTGQLSFYVLAKNTLETRFDKETLVVLRERMVKTTIRALLFLMDLPIPEDLKDRNQVKRCLNRGTD